MTFREDELRRIDGSGWSTCASVAGAVRGAGLPAPTSALVAELLADGGWARAESAVSALRERFSAARFADEVEWGLLLVPDPGRLDTRGGLPPEVRSDQLGTSTSPVPKADVVDERLEGGVLTVAPGPAWTAVATCVGRYGPALGSWDDVWGAPLETFAVDGRDTRVAMTRQLWGARVLQGGAVLPDHEGNDRWTFTLFPGEPTTDGLAASGTVLHGRVRFRLGKTGRGIGSARVAPALVIG